MLSLILGYGMVKIPLKLWKCSKLKQTSKYLEFKVAFHQEKIEDILFIDDPNITRLLVSAFLCGVHPEHEKYKEHMIRQALNIVFTIGYSFDLRRVLARGVRPYKEFKGLLSYSQLVSLNIKLKDCESYLHRHWVFK